MALQLLRLGRLAARGSAPRSALASTSAPAPASASRASSSMAAAVGEKAAEDFAALRALFDGGGGFEHAQRGEKGGLLGRRVLARPEGFREAAAVRTPASEAGEGAGVRERTSVRVRKRERQRRVARRVGDGEEHQRGSQTGPSRSKRDREANFEEEESGRGRRCMERREDLGDEERRRDEGSDAATGRTQRGRQSD